MTSTNEWFVPEVPPERRKMLVTHADLAFDQQHAVFTALEAKAGQYLTVASLGLAAAAATFPDNAAQVLGKAPSWLMAFTIAGGLSVVVSGLIVIVTALQVMRVQNVHKRETEREVVFGMFTDQQLLFEERLASKMLKGAHALCEVNERKAEWLSTTLSALYFFVAAVVGLGFATLLLVAR